MAKATTPPDEKPARAPRKPRQAAVTPGDATDQQEAGAKAPVSSPDGQAPGDEDDDTPEVLGRAEFFPGMGRFPEGWKPAQTTDKEPSVEAVQSPAWGLPDIAEFPAELTLVNNTRNILVVRPLNTRLMQFSAKTVQCPTAKHYAAIKHDLAGRALREGWDSDTGLQVKHGEDQD